VGHELPSAPSRSAAGAARPLRPGWLRRDDGLVFSWLIRLVVVLVVVALLLFEAGSVLLSRVTASDTAAKAAQEAGFDYRAGGDVNRARQVAQQIATGAGFEMVTFAIDPVARTTTVTVRKEAKTLFIQYIGPLRRYRTASATEITQLPT
jgi:hypothetical protein